MPVQNLDIKPIDNKEWAPIKAGLYQVQVGDITDTLRRPFGSEPDAPKTESFLTFHFAILNEGEVKGRFIVKDVRPVAPFPPSGGMKQSWLWRILSAIVGHPYTEEEATVFNADVLNSLIGKQLRIMVNTTEKEFKGKKRVYNNITDVLSVEKYMEPIVEDKTSPSEIQIDNSDIPF